MKPPQCLVNGSFELVLKISRFFCIAPVRLQKLGSASLVTMSRAYDWVGRFLITILCGMSVTNLLMDLNNFDNVRHDKNLIILIVILSYSILRLIINIIGVFGAYARSKRYIRYINALAKINVADKILPQNENCKVTAIAVVLLTACSSLIAVEINFRIKTNTSTDIALFLRCIQICENIFSLLLILQIACMSLLILWSLQAVNCNFEVIIVEIEKNRSSIIDYRQSERHLDLCLKFQRYTGSYLSICDMIRQLNKSEGSVMLILLSLAVLHLINSAFHGIIVSTFQNSVPEYLRTSVIIMRFIWSVYHVLCILLLIEPCHRTQEEVDQVKFLLGRLLCSLDLDYDPILPDLEKFYKHIMYQKPLYSPLNVCTFGRPLLTTIIAAVITCIVTFFQFNSQ